MFSPQYFAPIYFAPVYFPPALQETVWQNAKSQLFVGGSKAESLFLPGAIISAMRPSL